MATLVTLDGVTPQIGADVYLAPTAVLIGNVQVGDRANVWFGAVLRGDADRIEIGEEVSVQDNVVIHCAESAPTIVRRRVTIGHGALIEGCLVEEEALIGMGSTVLHYATVGAGAMLAAGTVVPERMQIPPGVLAAGVPAAVKKRLTGPALRWTQFAADDYQLRRHQYLTKSTVIDTDAVIDAS